MRGREVRRGDEGRVWIAYEVLAPFSRCAGPGLVRDVYSAKCWRPGKPAEGGEQCGGGRCAAGKRAGSPLFWLASYKLLG